MTIANRVPLLLMCCGLAAQAQSISIKSPTAAQNISGYSGFSFSATVASAPSAYRACWIVDAYQVGCATTPYSLPFNTFGVLNGTHTAGAVLYDPLNNVVATAIPVSFTVTNLWPVAYGPGMTVATGTSLTSNWSGSVSITPTITGSGATDSKNTTWFVDGVAIFTDTSDASVSPSYPLDTTHFANGVHIVAVVSCDSSGGTTYTDGYVGCMTEWSSPVTFANGATPYEIRSDAREIYLAPGATHQLAPTLYNTDGTTTSATPVYNSENTSIATVSSTGLVSAVSAGGAAASSSAKIDIMAPTITGTDIRCNPSFNCTNGEYSSATHPFKTQMVGQMVTIAAATGWVAGNYYIGSVNTLNQVTLLSCVSNVCATASPGLNSATNPTSFSTGPTRTAWAMVTPTATPNPPVYHFGNDGSILSTYTPGKSMYVTSMFNSATTLPATAPGNIGTDQPYSPGFVADYTAGGFTTIETSPILAPTASETESTFQAALSSQVGNFQSAVSGFNTKFLLITDSWVKQSGDGSGFGTGGGSGLFQTTRAIYSNSYTNSPLTDVLNAWNGVALQVEGGDEYSDYGTNPFEGPLTFTNGITSVVASNGTCTANGDFFINSALRFIISGSAVANLNSVNPATYGANQSFAPITFTCTGVPNGTYNSSNDPALTIEPYGIKWINNSTGLTASANDYIRYTAFATIKSQINAAQAGRPQWTFPQIATAGCSGTYGFANPANGLADYATKYYTGFVGTYLSARAAIHTLLGNGGATLGIGDVSRSFFGCYSASAPLLHQNSSVPINYGFEGFPLTVASFSGNTLTFSTPHNLPNIIPGVSRLTLSGMSNTADNGNYYILSTPTASTMTVANAVNDFAGTGNGGTLTFQNGDTKSIAASNGIPSSGANPCGTGGGSGQGALCGDSFTYAGSVDSTVNRHRGQTFTLSGVTGTGAAPFNSRTFVYLPENVQTPAAAFGNHYREIPQGNSVSGTASIIADNNFVQGRNGSTQLSQDPDVGFAGQVYNMILRGAGTRLYGAWTNQQAYNPTGGFAGINPINVTIFGDNSITNQQLYIHPHWENYYSAPNFHAIALANLLDQRIVPYSLTASLPTPDYGANFECTARTGTKGDMLACLNITNAPQTATFSLSPYLVSGQQILQFLANSQSIKLSTLTAGTATASVTLAQGSAAVFLFPKSFAAESQQPVISARLADVPNAVKIAVRYGYDRYLIDTGNTAFDCGAGTCTLPIDRQISTVFYRLIYLDTNANVLATSDVQVF